MKKTLHKYVLSIGIFALAFATQMTFAQGDSSKSRLNIGKKKDVLTRPIGNSRLIMMRQSGLDRGLSVKQSTAISNFYKSLLASSLPVANSLNTRVKAAEITTSVVGESKIGTEDFLKMEDRLFTNDKITVSNIYPNPANEYAEIDYSIQGNFIEAKIVIYNMLGSSVNNYDLDKAERKVRISTAEMANGIYFYQLSLDGKKVATKKLLIRHQ